MNNKILLNNAYRDIYISEERKKEILDSIILEKKSKAHPGYKKQVAAVIIACLITMSGIVAYAAVSGEWIYKMFPDTDSTNEQIITDLDELASDEIVTSASDEFTVSVIKNLYSKEQGIGLLVCVIKFSDDSVGKMPVSVDDEKVQKYITCNGIIDDEQDRIPLLSFAIENNDDSTIYSNPFIIKYDEEGYMIGTHYYLTPGTEMNNTSLILNRESGDDVAIENILTIQIPESSNLNAVPYDSKDVDGRTVYLSNVGICIVDDSPKNNELDMIAEKPRIVINPDSDKLDLKGEWSMSFVSDLKDSRYMNIKFNKIINTDEVASLEINGIIYKRAK